MTIPTKKIGDLDINWREKEDDNRGEVQETEVGTLLKKLDEEWCKEDEGGFQQDIIYLRFNYLFSLCNF